MLDIFHTIIDTLFPKHASIRVLEGVPATQFQQLYTYERHKNFVALSHYSEPHIKAAITANKFHDYPPAGALLGSLVTKYLSESSLETICIPIPLSPSRMKSRGYNQVLRILDSIEHITVADILVRTKNTAPQTSLHRAERLLNMQSAFAVKAGVSQFTHSRILIIDDVVTTGATLAAARTALIPYCDATCEIICVGCAH